MARRIAARSVRFVIRNARHQPTDVEDQAVGREWGREHRHRGRDVITCVDGVQLVSSHQPRAGKRAADGVEGRRGQRGAFVIAKPVPLHSTRPQPAASRGSTDAGQWPALERQQMNRVALADKPLEIRHHL